MDHRDSATRQVKAGGRRRPCHRRFPAPLLFLLSLIVLYHTPRAETPELVVTGVFIEESAEVDAAFVADGARDLAFAESSRLVELLAAVPGYRVHGDFLEDPAGEVKSLAQAANRVYVRATVTRADLKRVRYFGDYQVWTFSVGLRLEFFDIRSGQVYYGRTFTYRIPVETAVEIDRAYRYERFAEALAKALEECVTRCGKEYLPARAEAAVLGEAGEGALFLQGGSEAGFYPGLVLIAGDAGADPPEQWMLKLGVGLQSRAAAGGHRGRSARPRNAGLRRRRQRGHPGIGPGGNGGRGESRFGSRPGRALRRGSCQPGPVAARCAGGHARL